jgi:translocation and assembly module TamB
MTRRARILLFRSRVRNTGIGIAALAVAAAVSVSIVVKTSWFGDYVRRTIVSSIEDSTGGRVEVGSFAFDESRLRATIGNLVIHGAEPSTAPPFVSIARIEVDLRLFTTLRRPWDISFVGIDQPRVNVRLQADGRTNIPTPRHKNTSNNSLETVVDLAADRVDVSNGLAALFSARQPLSVRGSNVRIRLDYSVLRQAYQGTFAIQPLYVLNGRNVPVNFTVTLPLTLTKDRIDLHHATVTTPLSRITADASIGNMQNPRVSAHVYGRIAGSDLARAGNIRLAGTGRQTLPDLSLDTTVAADAQTIQVTALHAAFGQSRIEASGPLRLPRGNGALQLRAELGLGELGRLAGLSARPEGTITIDATASLDQANQYSARGNVIARNLAFTQGRHRFSGVGVVSSFAADNRTVDLNGLRVNAFGGEFAGNVALVVKASIEGLERFRLNGNIRSLDIQTVLRKFGEKLPYDGRVSGAVTAQIDTGAAGTRGLTANAHLAIAPGPRGIPVSGRLNADYKGAADDLAIVNSYLALPHSRLNLNGSLKQHLNVSLTSHDIRDLAPGAPASLNARGEADFTGAIDGSLSDPRVGGHFMVRGFAVEGRQFDTLSADVAASASAAALTNAVLTRGPMNTHADARIALWHWSPLPHSPIDVNAGIGNGDLADIMVLAGQTAAGYSGALSASIRITGTYGNPIGSATLQAVNGTLDDEPFNRIQVQAQMADRLAAIPAAYFEGPAGRVDLSAELHHPRESFSTGQIQAHVRSGTLNILRAEISGRVAVDADMTGTLESTQPAFLLSSVTGNLSAKRLDVRGVSLGDLTAAATTTGQRVSYNITSTFAGSSIQANGSSILTGDYPTSADLRVSALPIERALAAAARSDIAAKGLLSGTAHIQGTIHSPEGNADVDLRNANLYGERIDQAHLRAIYLARSMEIPQLEIVAGPSRIDATARFDHPADDFRSGQARFTLASNRLDLARSATVQRFRPGLAGRVDINADGAGTIRDANPAVLLTALNANISANGLTAEGKAFGDLELTAKTESAQRLTFELDSDLAGSTIRGSGSAVLNPQYPVDMRLSVHNVLWTRLAGLLGQKSAGPSMFEASADGDIGIKGPLMDSKQLSGSLTLDRLNVTTIPRSRAEKPVAITNQGPVHVALDRGVVHIESAHVAGPNTDVEATGSASLTGANLSLNVRANADLGIAQNFDRDVYSGGKVALDAAIRGDLPKPLINGRLTFQNATFGTTSIPLGISNANGAIIFNGNSATIRTLTAESGGGKLTVSGFASLGDTLRFALQTSASNVRLRLQPGLSATADANIRLTGTAGNSHVTGSATVNQISYTAQSDVGSMLTRSPPPVQAQNSPSILSNMKLDLHVRSLPGMTVQSSLSEDLQTDIDLRVRGSPADPGVLGRINVGSGKLVFFGTNYTVDTGTIAFYNPLRIEPVLDVSLVTQAKSVNVTVRVTGPADNLKLGYTSDPPLQFQEIVSLLAAGTTPVSDPTLLANQPAQPQQGFQQMGESVVLGQAVANPVGNQLQRVFGVTQLKIDPSFTTGSVVPTAGLAVQQRITNNLTFTYVSAIDAPNSTIIRMEWAFTQTWSAVATRDQFGLFSLNFFYKRGFR